ncbi:Uncharacterised protein [Buttiauxella agrestis]|uniref:Uncharacterized protein n=1 Tax=Buttiauxella agrestis TaxID=82977 RepID=A0A381C6I7_9ENTR|nr:Uncharacterised protein [Buttiauxella agrestis]
MAQKYYQSELSRLTLSDASVSLHSAFALGGDA